ncbi:2-keto-myo-inositol dehydratase [bacterium]|nr:MAG: 2-keto-myo-inositol dehydratase [bacterium]
MKVTLGSAPDSWGVWFAADPKQTPWQRFLDEVSAVGYRWIELGPFGYLPTDHAVLSKELERRQLRISGSLVMFPFEQSDAWQKWAAEVERTCAAVEGVGGKYLVLIDGLYSDLATGRALAPADLDGAGWTQLLNTTARIADVAEKHRLTPVLHPHAESHIEYESQVERFLLEADPRIGLCLDIGHHAYRGGDPIALLRRHHARIPYLHLKNVDREVQKLVEEEHKTFAEAVAMDVFVEPSRGAVDFTLLRDVLEEVEYDGFGIVEQDMYPAAPDKPLPIATRTYRYLRDLGFGQ